MKREPPVTPVFSAADLRIDALGDRAIHIRLGDVADEASRTAVRAYFERLIAQPPAGVHDVVPGFASLALHYDPARVHRRGDASAFEAMAETIRERLGDVDTSARDAGRLIDIPVCYDASIAPDLGAVASHTGLTTAEVIALHAASEYVVHMIGFLPGFPYLGGLDPRLTSPRRASPRGKVPAGSVGIGGRQTGVYTIESPGGWQLIGRTPTRLFDVRRDPPATLKIGDRVRFRPIALDEYRATNAT